MENKLQLSIILPAYNVENYLKKGVEAVLKQKTKISFEVIVVDDGSTDNTLELAQECFGDDPRVTIISQVNQGSGMARNTGFNVAKGEYIFFMDPDDSIEDDMFASIFDALEEEKVKPDLVMFSNKRHYESGKEASDVLILEDKKLYVTNEEIIFGIPNFYKESVLFVAWAKVIRRNFLLENKIKFTAQRTGQDALFSLDTFKFAQSLLWLPQKYYLYNVGREGSAQTRKNPQKVFDEMNILAKMKSLLATIEDDRAQEVLSDYIMYIALRELQNIEFSPENYSTFKSTLKSSPIRVELSKVKFSKLVPIKKLSYLICRSSLLSYFYYTYKVKRKKS